MKHNVMTYKGYSAVVEFDARDGVFVGRLLHLNDVIAFEGTTVAELREAMQDAVEEYLEWCREDGVEPEKPYSGQFVLRVEPELHKDMATCAASAGMSLNTWIVEACQTVVAQEHARTRGKENVAVRTS
jgi:predicted HicB family RNase H-like nuclease